MWLRYVDQLPAQILADHNKDDEPRQSFRFLRVKLWLVWSLGVTQYQLSSEVRLTVNWGQPRQRPGYLRSTCIRRHGAFRVMYIITDDKRWLCQIVSEKCLILKTENCPFLLIISLASLFFFRHKKSVLKLARMLFLTKTCMKFNSLLSKYFVFHKTLYRSSYFVMKQTLMWNCLHSQNWSWNLIFLSPERK